MKSAVLTVYSTYAEQLQFLKILLKPRRIFLGKAEELNPKVIRHLHCN